MAARARRHLPIMAAVAVTAMLVGGGPPLAAAVFDADNADKVDGRHAVGSGADAAQRAGKLVATNADGQLPNSILSKALDANRLDNLDSTSFQRKVTGTCSDAQKLLAVGAGGGVSCSPDRINGGNATSVDGLDSTAFQRQAVRTIFVSPLGTPTQNGQAFRQALATLPGQGDPGAPSDTSRWVIKIEPGTYEFTSKLQMGPFVDFHGSGPGTVITCSCPATGTVEASNDAELRDLKVVNVGGGIGSPTAIGIAVPEVDAVLHNLDIEVTNADLGIGILSSGNVAVTDSRIFVQSQNTAEGITFDAGTNTVSDTSVHAQGGGVRSAGLTVFNGVTTVEGSTILADNSSQKNTTLHVHGGTATVTSSSLSAGGFSPVAVHEQTGVAHIVSSKIAGPISGAPSCQASYNASHGPLDANCSV